MRFLLGFFMAFLLIGCGYKPISKLTQDIMDERVYVDVIISKTEPKNSVLIKDAVKEGIVSRLHKTLSDKQSANTLIEVSNTSIRYQAMVYDEFGYISEYKVILGLNFKTTFKDGKTENISTVGEYDFSVSRRISNIRYADSVISDTEKFTAIKEASKEAFDEYISKLAIKGYKHGSN
ncbi:LPS assembly lipoprotein LptE [Campylobacter suis]|nr:LPS assembly lipoprotein LptE [Campylobacter suis]